MAPKKATKMSLNDFLDAPSSGGFSGGSFGSSGVKTSWADEMDDLPTAPAPREPRAGIGGDYLSSMPDRKDRDAGFNSASGGGYGAPGSFTDMPLPTQPPYTAFIGNLNFDIQDVEVREFLHPLTVTSVRLVNGHDGRPKGFGYVEFATLDDLKGALERQGSSFGGRTVRISVAEPRTLHG